MKWAIVGLTVMGIAAAACAALLVGALRAGSMAGKASPEQDGEVQVLYAKMPLDAMTVVDGSMVATKPMQRSKAPKDFIADPVQVVGRVLTLPLLEGQAFSATSFAADSSANVAAAVKNGKRLVGISVSDFAGLEGLLYPGCVVDVMVTLKPDMGAVNSSKTLDAPITTTLLQRVQVVAIERQTVVSGSPEKVGTDVEAVSRPNSTRRVTLLVDTKQAKQLQFAMQQGALSLAMRNPLDTTDSDREQISLRTILGLKPFEDEVKPAAPAGPSMLERMFNKAMEASAKMAAARQQPSKVDPFAKTLAAPEWETTVIRGDNSQKYLFPMPQQASQQSDGKSDKATAAVSQQPPQPEPDRPAAAGADAVKSPAGSVR